MFHIAGNVIFSRFQLNWNYYLARKCFKIQVEGNTYIVLSQTIKQDHWQVFWKKHINVLFSRDWLPRSDYSLLLLTDQSQGEKAEWVRNFPGPSQPFWYVCILSFTSVKGYLVQKALFYVAQPKISGQSKQHSPPLMDKASSASPEISDIRKKETNRKFRCN